MAVVSPPQGDPVAYPLQSFLVPFPFVCFTLALATDVAFWTTVNLMWQNFSAWLLFAGLVFGGLALVAAVIDIVRPRTRLLRPNLLSAGLYIVVLLLAFINSLVHAGDGWTAVVPTGLILSAATFVLCLIAAVVSARKYARLAWRA